MCVCAFVQKVSWSVYRYTTKAMRAARTHTGGVRETKFWWFPFFLVLFFVEKDKKTSSLMPRYLSTHYVVS